ncbi:MAG: WS/DGAT domain-containing protein [Actinomycetota bacterium]|nr:WS/DGAT domain-containing protein [Actinomycetota bacterium]
MADDKSGVGTQLRGWDAATFRTASANPNLRSTVIALAVLDRAPDWERLHARLNRLTLFVPVLRKRPLYGATGFSAPRLAVDPDFDLDVHVRRYRLPVDAGWEGLLADARRMSLTDFDHNRPLWEAVLIEGLPGDQSAFLLKLHHSIADGAATVQIAMSLFEFSGQANPAEPVPPPAPESEDVSVTDVTIANLTDNLKWGTEQAVNSIRGALGLVRGTMTEPTQTWSRVWNTVSSIGRFTSVSDGPMSPVLAGRGTTYRFAAFNLPFAALRGAAKSRELSVNDAFLAALAGGFDIYHRRHGVVVDELRINVPISLRGDPGDRTGQASNAVSIARFPFPIAGLSVGERMTAAHDLISNWRAEPALRLADPLAEVSWLVPVPMLAQAAQSSDVTASNVPGPPIPLYLAGAKMLAAYPLVATIGAAVNVTLVTYDGTAYVGISADDRAVKDLSDLVEDLRAGFAEVVGDQVGPRDQYAAPSA